MLASSALIELDLLLAATPHDLGDALLQDLAQGTGAGDPGLRGAAAVGGAQGFPGFQPKDEVDATRNNFGGYADLELDASDPKLFCDVVARV